MYSQESIRTTNRQLLKWESGYLKSDETINNYTRFFSTEADKQSFINQVEKLIYDYEKERGK